MSLEHWGLFFSQNLAINILVGTEKIEIGDLSDAYILPKYSNSRHVLQSLNDGTLWMIIYVYIRCVDEI